MKTEQTLYAYEEIMTTFDGDTSAHLVGIKDVILEALWSQYIQNKDNIETVIQQGRCVENIFEELCESGAIKKVREFGLENVNKPKQSYKVGDVGPAGGIVFMQHDDGTCVECWIHDEPEEMTWDEAREHVKTFNHGGYNDWVLPTKEELNKMYENKDQIGNLKDSFYWSDAEYSEIYAWLQNISTGNQFYISKSDFNGARAVRRFK